jgi:hypothetical protein
MTNAATVTVQVYPAPQITVTPMAQYPDCTVAYVGWTTLSASLSSSSATASSIQWYYTSAANPDNKLPVDGNSSKNGTTMTVSILPEVTQTDWIEVIDVCGVEGWGSGTITVPDQCVCFGGC